MIKQWLTRKVASDTAVARLGQVVCFAGACVIPVLVSRKFAELELPGDPRCGKQLSYSDGTGINAHCDCL